MNKMFKIVALSLAATCIIGVGLAFAADEQKPADATSAAAAAPAPDVTGSVSFSALNQYIFRGAEVS